MDTKARLDGTVKRCFLRLEPVVEIELLLRLMQLLCFPLHRQHGVRQSPQPRKEVDKSSSTSLVEICKVGEAFEKLFHLLVLVGRSAPPKHHGSRECICVASNMFHEVVRLRKKLVQHLLILKHLIWHIRLGRSDVQHSMNQLPSSTPPSTVALVSRSAGQSV